MVSLKKSLGRHNCDVLDRCLGRHNYDFLDRYLGCHMMTRECLGSYIMFSAMC